MPGDKRRVKKGIKPVAAMPPKTWPKMQSTRAARKQRTRKKTFAVTSGGTPSSTALALTDARMSTTKHQEVTLTNQLRTVTVGKPLTGSSLIAFCAGYLSKAYERGFYASSSAPEVPYYALTFMVNTLASYAQAQAVPTTQMPYWFLEVCHAISPKIVRNEGGATNYQFVVGTNPVTVPVNSTIGFAAYGNMWSAGKASGTTVNGFPQVDPTISGYTELLGAGAFQELAQFMAQSSASDVERTMSRLVPSSTQTPFTRDVSAFALVKLAEGTGFTGQGGGIYAQVQLEVPIFHPLFALFGCGQDSFLLQAPTRNYTWALPVSGDPATLAVVASTLLPSRMLSAKRHIRMKPVDFFEFADVLAIWVSLIQTAFIATLDPSGDIGDRVATAQCPLTLQEVMILLRSVIMGAFKASQSAVQGICPFTPSASTDNEFVAYVCGVNCGPSPMCDMQLPMPLIENIRALVARFLKYGASAHDVQWYFPILGQYALDVLNPTDYVMTVLVDGTLSEFASFASPAGIWEEEYLGPKGEVKTRSLAEVPISMIDGAAGSNLVFINDPTKIRELSAQWNTWLTSSGVQSFSVQTGTMGTDQGINVLCSISMTRIWVNVGGGSHLRGREERLRAYEEKVRKAPKVNDLRRRLKKNKALVATPYATRQAITDTSQGEFLASAYEQVLQTWILPINDDEQVVGEQSTILQRWQFQQGEPYSVARVAAETGITLSSLHMAYAAKMTKSQLSEKADWSVFFEEMEKKGRGGILSGLVAGLVGTAFPSVKGLASGIADALPF